MNSQDVKVIARDNQYAIGYYPSEKGFYGAAVLLNTFGEWSIAPDGAHFTEESGQEWVCYDGEWQYA